MKISYLITCSNETDTLNALLSRVYDSIQYNETDQRDEIVLLVDSKDKYGNDINKETSDILYDFTQYGDVNWHCHSLDNNYGAHKNYGIERCSGNFIWQLDGDELPPETLLGENLHSIIDSNPNIEAYAVPRINDFKGVTEEHAKKWGWRLSISPTYKRPIVNFPDFQFRIFKRDLPRISFLRRLHEKIEGYNSYVCLPAEEEYAIYHDKTIEKQIETNLRYNTLFTEKENRGHNVFGNK